MQAMILILILQSRIEDYLISENEVYITIEPLNNMISTDIVNFEMSAIDSRDSDSFSVTCSISNEAMDGLLLRINYYY